jgi:hypothetical protein
VLLCLISQDFDVGGPYNVNSTAFAADLAEVREIGRLNATGKTAYQAETAVFYALGEGTCLINLLPVLRIIGAVLIRD